MLGGLLIGCIFLLVFVNNISLGGRYHRPLRSHHFNGYLPPDYRDYEDYEDEHRTRYNFSRLINALLFAFLLLFGIFYFTGQHQQNALNYNTNAPIEQYQKVDYQPKKTSLNY